MSPRRFERIAILNRGEAAVRFVRAVRELDAVRGERTTIVAFMTDIELQSYPARLSDEVVDIGSALRDSARGPVSAYCDTEHITRLLVQARCDAVWPGWGFASEDPEFVARMETEGIAFIGPPSIAMRALGDKIASKRLAEASGVPLAPWATLEGDIDAHVAAASVGYPLMVKASAGGGGRGIRRVESPEQLADAIVSARGEAERAFGDGRLFLERAISAARHVEVQFVVDAFGSAHAIGVRDCSIQRRNQKLVEETPSPVLPAAVAASLRAGAEALAAGAGYRGVGTAEFLYSPADGAVAFLEVNSRLQVEHTITEMLTGADLVRAQLLIARGLEWEPPAEERGHAIEVRLNAENPDAGFAPSPGRVPVFRVPSGLGVRVDTAIVEGSEVPAAFDSMIAKVIAWAPSRPEAIARLRRALDELAVVVEGGATNKAFLAAILRAPEFVTGEATTRWLDTTGRGVGRVDSESELAAFVAAAVLTARDEDAREVARFLAQAQNGVPQHLPAPHGRIANLRLRGRPAALWVYAVGRDRYEVEAGGATYRVAFESAGSHAATLVIDGRRHRLLFADAAVGRSVEVDGALHTVEVVTGGEVTAPAPAMVVAVSVASGDVVEAGQRLCMLEAMKMELPVVAREGGVVRHVHCRPSVQVVAGEVLFEIETGGAATREDVEPVSFPAAAPRAIDLLFAGSAPRPELLDDAPAELVQYVVAEIVETARGILLGYDVSPTTVDRVERLFGAQLDFPGLRRFEHWAPLAALLATFADVEALFSRELAEESAADGSEISPQLAFYEFCRCSAQGAAGVPALIAAPLQAALAHYGVRDLEPGDALREALWRMAVAHAHDANRNRLCSSLMRLVIGLAGAGIEVPRGELHGVLERVAALASDEHPYVADNAHQAAYVLFKRPSYVSRGRLVQDTVDLVGLEAAGRRGDSAAPLLAPLIATAQSALPYVLRSMHADVVTFAAVALARLHALERVEPSLELVGDDTWVGEWAGGAVVVSSTVEDALASMPWVVGGGGRAVDVLLSRSPTGPVEPPPVNDRWPADAELCFVWPEAGDQVECRAFAREGDGWEVLYPVHPVTARRLELPRLDLFELERIPSPERMLAFAARARSNPRDERIFVRAEVLGPVDADTGWPRWEFERVYYEGLRLIREAQAGRGRRNRFYRNRLTIYVRATVAIDASRVRDISRGLEAPTRRLGLESVNVRTFVEDSSAPDGRRAVEFVISKPGRHRLDVRFRDPVSDPIAPLTAYEQRVVTARRLGLVYPYEIIAMLEGRGSEAGETSFSVERGEFVELDLDLDGDGRLVPVDRPHGKNTAGVIVGIISNQTALHPDGMERVFIASDPTRALGTLAEPECARVCAALDIAEERGVPVEWIAVSSGAKIAMDSGTENLDATARVLRRIVHFTQRGGEINVIVPGVNVGAQSYWNAEATMLMHTRGVLIMTRDGSMVLTGKKALEYSGSVSAEDEKGIGGADRVMGPNGQAQYVVRDLGAAYATLFEHYRYTWRRVGAASAPTLATTDPDDRSILDSPYEASVGGFATVGEIFDEETNPGRKRPFAIRAVMAALIDRDGGRLERWRSMRSAEMVVVWDAFVGGVAASVIGIESQPLPRFGRVPADGPDRWTGATLFPRGSKKLARAINAASGNRPLVVLANLSGFDGSPESLRKLQLEYGAEVGRAVVNFEGRVVFVVVGRYHGGAYVVFSKALNAGLTSMAVQGAYASVIGGAPAAAVVFPREVRARADRDPRVQALRAALGGAPQEQQPRLREQLEELYAEVMLSEQLALAAEFDAIHTVERAVSVGSLDAVVPAARLRQEVIATLRRG
ncbi:MAG: ATP-grasp domain-containing protein [Myxococcales bacterium]|nr:ATP-grasp domain-containing protein [Myxococcales bacterium]MCB9532366.1 ATP-grasp domain-containing protein [Myxococcales bacterium]